jgi:hypothetical protein
MATPATPPRMLAVGSGGNKFIELLEAARVLRNETGQDWQNLAGISAGALLCGMISMLPLNDLRAFNAKLDDAIRQFSDNTKASPFRPWIPLGAFASALFAVVFRKPSLFRGNTTFVRKQFRVGQFHASGRRLMVGVFDNTLQKYKTVDSCLYDARDLGLAIAASSAVPVVTPPVLDAHKHLCRDGGLVHSIPVREIVAFVTGRGRQKVHVDLLISDALEDAPLPSARTTVTSSLMDMCASLVWSNLQKDLRYLTRRLLVDTPRDVERVLWKLRTGKQHNFERPWGTMRVVSPVSLGPRRMGRKVRTSFRVPEHNTTRQLRSIGHAAATAALHST